MKDIYDIFDEFQEKSSTGAKEKFCISLKKYIHEKYNGTDEHANRVKFIAACADYILDLEKYQTSDFDSKSSENQRRIKNTASKNVTNWLDSSKSIKRETIIDIAFILADKKKKNGEDVANALLQDMHYQKLHASSEIEIMYIYALRNGLTYVDGLKLYSSYLARNGVVISNKKEEKNDETSTVFHNEIINISNQEGLFEFLDRKRQHFGVASRKMNAFVSKLFYRMLSYKIIIKSDISGSKTVTDLIKNAIEEEKYNTNSIASGLVEDCLKIAPYQPFVIYLSNKKTADLLYDAISTAGGNAEIFKSRYESKMDLKVDFFLFYASNKPLDVFKNEFSDTMGGDYNRLECDAYIKDKRSGYPIFYPIKGHSCPTESSRPASDGCLFSTVFDGFTEVLKNQKSLSREGLLLWLLFYYRMDGGKEDYLDMADINTLIGSRYSSLNENNYFDNFVITILSIESHNGKLFYKYGKHKEEIDKSDLNTENIHQLRHSIIRLFDHVFNPDFAAEYFTEKSDNTTTSAVFKSTKKRLGIE